MRNKTIDQEYLDFSIKSTLKVVQEYRAKYEMTGQILEANPKILDIAHGDFGRALSQSEYGRGGYTSEQILRSIVVMFIEGKSYRDTVSASILKASPARHWKSIKESSKNSFMAAMVFMLSIRTDAYIM